MVQNLGTQGQRSKPNVFGQPGSRLFSFATGHAAGAGVAPPISHHFLKEVNSPLTLFAGCLALLDGWWSGCGAILDFGGCGRVAAPVERSRRNSLLWHGSERRTGGVVQPATSVRRRVGECAGATHVIRQRELRRHLRLLGIHSALRILKPGGLLIFSTHGSYYLPRLRGDDRRRFRMGTWRCDLDQWPEATSAAVFTPKHSCAANWRRVGRWQHFFPREREEILARMLGFSGGP